MQQGQREGRELTSHISGLSAHQLRPAVHVKNISACIASLLLIDDDFNIWHLHGGCHKFEIRWSNRHVQ